MRGLHVSREPGAQRALSHRKDWWGKTKSGSARTGPGRTTARTGLGQVQRGAAQRLAVPCLVSDRISCGCKGKKVRVLEGSHDGEVRTHLVEERLRFVDIAECDGRCGVAVVELRTVIAGPACAALLFAHLAAWTTRAGRAAARRHVGVGYAHREAERERIHRRQRRLLGEWQHVLCGVRRAR